MRRAVAAGLAAALVACSPDGGAVTPAAAPGACVSERFEGAEFTRCTAVPGRHTIRTVVGDPPYRDLGRLSEALGTNAGKVAFATNGGMYDEAGQPIGYYVEAGKRTKKLNRAQGFGNFHLLPNGVFSVEAGADRQQSWRIRTADAFAARVRQRPAYATQSGPMLVIAGKLHPKIAPDGESLNLRNAVGIDGRGRAHFVISEQAVSFGKLARYMRDELRTPDALFLDGSVSALWDPARGRIDRTVPLGPLIVVEKAEKAEAAKRKPR